VRRPPRSRFACHRCFRGRRYSPARRRTHD